ncbi:MAG: nitrate reductase molybdenum cofactor assembly chaperone [Gemmatimonadota bacterium]
MQLLATVLEYPEPETAAMREELVALLDDWKPEAAEALRVHTEALADMSLYDQQERYAATFDVNPAVCLYVGYHVFGDSYPRGVFMSRLAGAYEKAGFQLDRELPDHVPAVLRYLACSEAVDPVELVDDALVPALRKIVGAFAETTSPYAALLEATLRTFERPENAEVQETEGPEADGRRTLALPVFSNREDRALTPSPEAAAMIASRPKEETKP